MRRLINRVVKGLIFGSLMLLPSLGFSQEKARANFPERYSSVASIGEFPTVWKGFTREYVPQNLRFELTNEFSNINSFKENYHLKSQATVQESFKLGLLEPYLGAGLVYRNYNLDPLKVNTTFVGGVDMKLKDGFNFYLQFSQEFKQQPEFWFGLIKKF